MLSNSNPPCPHKTYSGHTSSHFFVFPSCRHLLQSSIWDYVRAEAISRLYLADPAAAIPYLPCWASLMLFLSSLFADTTIYNMCTQKPPYDHSEQLYLRYREAFRTYINDTVLPSLRGAQGEHLLRQLVERWKNHKIMVRWLSRFFNYLDRYYIQRHNLHSLNDVGLIVFRGKCWPVQAQWPCVQALCHPESSSTIREHRF